MRIWSLHPEYLDTKGLLAVWRETLLAKKVLENKTKGYKNHPQLDRFKNSQSPLLYINKYLEEIYLEAKRRNYNFDKSKFNSPSKILDHSKNKFEKISVTDKQVEYEFSHLMKKLKERDKEKYKEIKKVLSPTLSKVKGEIQIKLHPIFKIKKGEIENWEKY